MALLTVASITTTTGNTPSYTAANSTDTISSSDISERGVILHVKTGGTGTTVTVGDPGSTPAGNAAAGSPAGKAYVLGATAEARIPVNKANVDPATGLATITYSAVTSVTAQAFRY